MKIWDWSGVEMPRASHTICEMDLRARTNGPAWSEHGHD